MAVDEQRRQRSDHVLMRGSLHAEDGVAKFVAVATEDENPVPGGFPTMARRTACVRRTPPGRAASEAAFRPGDERPHAPGTQPVRLERFLGPAPGAPGGKQEFDAVVGPADGLPTPALCPGNHPVCDRPVQIDEAAGASYPPRPAGTDRDRPHPL